MPTNRPPTHPGEMQGITSDTALRLERVLGMSAAFWLTLQQRWDLWQAPRSPAAKQIQKLKPLPLARAG